MKTVIFTPFAVFLLSCQMKPFEEHIVGIQPYNGFSKAKTDTVAKTIRNFYHIKVIALAQKQLDKNAFVNVKSPRYRADSIIKFQKQNKAADFIFGLTSKDISTTKKDEWGNIKKPAYKYADWGIMGLAYCPGKSAVVSDFRLRTKDQKLYFSRLKKVAIHEFGHNLGLSHCTNKRCVMTDAVESIITIDRARLALCDECKERLD